MTGFFSLGAIEARNHLTYFTIRRTWCPFLEYQESSLKYSFARAFQEKNHLWAKSDPGKFQTNRKQTGTQTGSEKAGSTLNAPACGVAPAEGNRLRLQRIKRNKGLAGLHSPSLASCMYSETARSKLLFSSSKCKVSTNSHLWTAVCKSFQSREQIILLESGLAGCFIACQV